MTAINALLKIYISFNVDNRLDTPKMTVKTKVSDTHSGTPSVRSAVSDLISSLPGVLAGCGVAGDCLSDTGAATAADVEPGEAAMSLASSSAGAGDG